MKNLRFSFGFLLFLIGIGFVFNFLHGSVFYTSLEDEGPSRVGLQDNKEVGSIIEVNKPKSIPKKQLAPTDPERLIIPNISIDAHIQQVGLSNKGNMAVPTSFKEVGWYKHGPRPGDLGSAVMDGHVDNALGLDGVFSHLHQLVPGDDVYIIRHDGAKLHFKVEKVETYQYDHIPASTIFESQDGRRLNLITCGGNWIKDQKTYSERVVVYTKLVN